MGQESFQAMPVYNTTGALLAKLSTKHLDYWAHLGLRPTQCNSTSLAIHSSILFNEYTERGNLVDHICHLCSLAVLRRLQSPKELEHSKRTRFENRQNAEIGRAGMGPKTKTKAFMWFMRAGPFQRQDAETQIGLRATNPGSRCAQYWQRTAIHRCFLRQCLPWTTFPALRLSPNYAVKTLHSQTASVFRIKCAINYLEIHFNVFRL